MKRLSLLLTSILASASLSNMASATPVAKEPPAISYSNGNVVYGRTKGKRSKSLKSRSNRRKAKAKKK